METNFKPMCVYVTYNMNRLCVAISPNGVTVKELIRLSGALLSLRTDKYRLTRNGTVQLPFGRVVQWLDPKIRRQHEGCHL